MPPSVNKGLMSVRGRLIKTNASRVFTSKVKSFKIRNCRLFDDLESKLKDKTFRVDYYFVFAKKRCIGIKNQIKQLDVSNYLKPAQDGLSFCLNIDDKFIKSSFIEMIQCNLESQEQVIIVITQHNSIKTIEELLVS